MNTKITGRFSSIKSLAFRIAFALTSFTLISGLSAKSLEAKETSLVRIVRTDNGSTINLNLRLNQESDLQGFVLDFGGGERQYITYSEVDERSKVLYKQSGQNILTLKAKSTSIYSGGDVELTYLKEYNIVGSNDYRKLTLQLERDGDSWSLTRNGRKVSKLTLNTYKWGISSITVE